ncbi:hypothetical protein [Pantoea ananatis]|uniref:hypothetical protein n=1 Tax=Pantoea ananas TaxID=553 RepID=UPI001B30EBF6|nr:hypothetical protein [Pantoea ananatis]MCW1833554.1 hypothetical protein [Pantoea ananatis]
MNKYKNLQEVADYLGNGGPFNPNEHYRNVGEMIDAMVFLGNTEQVYVHHDDHVVLKDGLSQNLIDSPIDDIDEEKYANEIEEILWQANKIIALSERELTEDDEEEIKEDKLTRGEYDE